MRRIHLHREQGQEDVLLLTDLREPDEHPADDLLEVYLHRWGIEQMFQKVTEVFNLKTLRRVVGPLDQVAVEYSQGRAETTR